MGTLTGKTAVVTGSTSGIGLAYARAFAGAGANIVLNGMGVPADIEKERSGIETDFKVKAVHSPADMTKPAEIAEMVALGEKTFGSVDILVNNAGIQFVSPIEEFPPEKWEAIIAINLSSAFYGIRAAVPGMKKRGWGRIINMASLNGVNAHMGTLEYNSAKEALRAASRTAAREWASTGITVNVICPAAKSASFRRVMQQNPELEAAADAGNPMGRMGDPDGDIAPVAVFLASDASRYLTGNTLFVDGGGHINGSSWAPDLGD